MRRPPVYRVLFDRVLRRVDAETAHLTGSAALRAAAAVPGLARLGARVLGPHDPALRVRALGLELPGPLGLAAGLDKDGRAVDALAGLGFAFVEVGTVTARPQPGNPRPRLVRLPDDRAVVNRMGFNNAGAAALRRRLHRRLARRGRTDVVVGVNIGRTKAVPEERAVDDYVTSTRALAPVADYLVVNVSSPNTPGLRDLQAVERLRPLLVAVRAAADQAAGRRVPLLVKIAPDLTDEDVLAVADLALDLGLDGIVATNTTTSRDGLGSDPAKVAAAGPGGLSGPCLRARSVEVLRLLRARVGDRLVLVSVGGVSGAEDVWERIRAGATLVQAYTAFVYEGPAWPRRVHHGLLARVRASGLRSVTAAIGLDAGRAGRS
ncbi:MAG TPA: quinone-dependent dihydroorotate dehydrogenase [Jiangellales bacterium]|nr:quinone-dependent dihydroorotate dehydrogenase [Jiangellales bacterium]